MPALDDVQKKARLFTGLLHDALGSFNNRFFVLR